MLGKDIERKLTVFISSKIDERYKLIRHALKTLLMETGIVASVIGVRLSPKYAISSQIWRSVPGN